MIVASGADDGQIILSQASTGQKLHAFSAYQSKVIPVTGGITFSKHSEFLATGLADGIVKLWDLKRRIQLRTFRSNAPFSYNYNSAAAQQYNSSPATSICFNAPNSLLACSNSKGLISLFPTTDLTTQGSDAAPLTNYTPEICIFKQNEHPVH